MGKMSRHIEDITSGYKNLIAKNEFKLVKISVAVSIGMLLSNLERRDIYITLFVSLQKKFDSHSKNFRTQEENSRKYKVKKEKQLGKLLL